MAILNYGSTLRTADGGQTTTTIVTAANIGTYGVATNSTYYVGTTQNIFNRASGAQTLTGVSIDGNAANITAYTINQNVGTGNAPSFAGITSTSTIVVSDNTAINFGNTSQIYHNSARAATQFTGTSGSDTMCIKDASGYVGIGITNPSYKLEVYSGSKISAFTGLSISNFNNYDGTAASLITSQLRFAILENPIGTYEASQRTFAILESGNEANNSSSNGFFAISTRLSGAVAEKFRITAAGNVGIGTSSPSQKLHVVGTAYSDTDFRAPIFYDSANTAYYLDPANTGTSLLVAGSVGISKTSLRSGSVLDVNGYGCFGASAYGFYIGTDATGAFLDAGSQLIRMFAGSSEKLRIQADGNVGIGTTSPTGTYGKLSVAGGIRILDDNNAKLEIGRYSSGASNSYIKLGSNSNSLRIANNTDSVDIFTIENGGNVGIGTTSPGYKLEVIGAIRASSTHYNTNGDLNALRGSLTTMGYNLTNSPSGAGWITVTTSQCYIAGGDIASQIAYDNYNQQKLFTRYSADFGATWSAWKTIINSDALSGTTNYVPKFSGTNSIGNSLIYDNGTNVGIGTTSPSQKFHVSGIGYSDTDFRAPIFYDSNNTAYYCDPASTSNFNAVNLGTLQINGSTNWSSAIVNSSGNKTLAYNIWQGGKKLNADEDFNNGTNGITLYNNSGGSALSITRTALSTAPNSSGFVLRVSYSTATSNGTSPGFGGFFFATSSAANKVFVTRFIANIPSGRTINFQSNGYGTNATNYWLTNNVGTGKWEEYALIVMCGDSGTFSSTNFFNISGGSDISFTWDIASATVFDITNKYEMVSRVLTADLAVSSPVYYDKDNTAYYIDAASTSNLVGLTVANTITGSVSGNAATVTTNANLTGHITSVGNATSLGSFTSAQLLAALTDETGTGANVFATSPTLVSPALGTPSSGTLTNCTFPTLNQNTTGTSSNITAYTINQSVGTANSPTFVAVTTSTDGANYIMAGSANAEGIRMTPASSTTYPVFLRSINPAVGEASPWIYKEQATDWGIWHNNPINTIDFTKAGSGGIASNVGGSATNTVVVRVDMGAGYVQTIAGYKNSAGTTILSDAGNITGSSASCTGNAATATNGLTTSNYVGYSAFTGSVSSGGNITATSYIYTSTYLQTGGNLIYPSGYGATQRLEVGNSANNNWIDGITIAPGGIVTAPYNMRSPIYYDSDNTAYYLDPASTSNLSGLTVANIITGSVSGNSSNVTISNLNTQQVSVSLAAGSWYTIAANDANRASAKFTITDTSSGLHQAIHFYATAHYGTDSGAKISVISNTYYSGPPVSAIKIMRGGTYDGAMVQIYAMSACALTISIYDNQQSSGWVIKSGVVSTTNPGTVAAYASLTTMAAQVDLSAAKSFSVSDEIYIGGATTQYKALHANNYNSYALPLTGGTVSGLVRINNQLQVGQNTNGTAYIDAYGGYAWFGRDSNTTGIRIDGSANVHMTNALNVVNAITQNGNQVLNASNYVGYSAFTASLTSTVDARAPIFYDSNDTAYYVNPNSSSSLVDVIATEFFARNWFRNNDSGEGLYNTANTNHFYSDSADYWNITSPNSQVALRFRTAGYGGTVRGYIYADTSNNVGLLNQDGNWRLRVVGGDYSLADGSSMRAQIFYDSNDTTYYCDPAGTSSLSSVVFNGLSSADYTRQSAPSGGYFYAGGAQTGAIKIRMPVNSKTLFPMLSFTCHIYNYSTGTSRTFKIGGHFSTSSWYNPFAYCLSESAGNLNVRWGYEGNYLVVWIGETNSGWSYPSVFITDFQNGYSAINSSWMTGWNVSLVTVFDTVTNGPAAAGFFWNQNNDGAGSGLDADLLDGINSASFLRSDVSATNSVDLRAPLFYDSNNTAYYLDPASTSVMNQINLAGILRRTASAAGYLEGNYPTGVDGNSSSAIYTIGGGYQPTATGLGNMYGCGYTVGNGTANPGLGATGWGFYVAGGGVSRIFLDSEVGYGIASNSWRAPIFYDSNNTAYYVDPNSTSNLVGLTVANTITGSITGNAGGSSASCTGNAASASYANEIIITNLGTATVSINNGRTAIYRNENGLGAALAYSPVLHAGAGDTMWQVQGTYGSSGNGTFYFRQGYQGVFGNWLTMLSSANYNSYSPTLTGTGASGTWSINVTGNAGGSSASCTGNAASATTAAACSGNAANVTGTVAIANGGTGATSAGAAATNLGLGTGNTPKFLNVFGERVAVTSTASTTVNTQYNVTELTMSAFISTLTFSNIQASGIVHMWTIVTLGNGSATSVTWPATVKWPGGTAPNITGTNTKRDIYQFVTYDGGTTIYAIIVGQNL